jgi:hypothetical protein
MGVKVRAKRLSVIVHEETSKIPRPSNQDIVKERIALAFGAP